MEGNSSAVVTAPLTNGQATTPAIKIDKGVPMPTPGRRGPCTKYPWEAMQVGDSFAVPAPTKQHENSMRRAASMWAARNGKKTTASVGTENGERVVRVWRVS